MSVFTVIADFDGGTYIGQAEAESPREAAVAWAERLDAGEILGVGRALRSRLVEALLADDPTPINAIRSCWCMTVQVRGKLMLVNVVKTAIGEP